MLSYEKPSSIKSDDGLWRENENFKFKQNFRILIAEDTPMHRVNIKHILVEEFNIDESRIVFVEDGIKAYHTVLKSLVKG